MWISQYRVKQMSIVRLVRIAPLAGTMTGAYKVRDDVLTHRKGYSYVESLPQTTVFGPQTLFLPSLHCDLNR